MTQRKATTTNRHTRASTSLYHSAPSEVSQSLCLSGRSPSVSFRAESFFVSFRAESAERRIPVFVSERKLPALRAIQDSTFCLFSSLAAKLARHQHRDAVGEIQLAVDLPWTRAAQVFHRIALDHRDRFRCALW